MNERTDNAISRVAFATEKINTDKQSEMLKRSLAENLRYQI